MSEVIDNHDQVNVIYMDVSKAFEKNDYELSFTKIEYLGFSCKLLQLSRSYVDKQKQFVTYYGHNSDEYITTPDLLSQRCLVNYWHIVYID